MKKHSRFTQSFKQLPSTIAIFPLKSAIVLPGGLMPLNIFEPRYVNMVRDAMRAEQLIGMIQPKDQSEPPQLYDIGCAGRIIRYEETQDGRLEILLAGVCRFSVDKELDSIRGYRIVAPNWSNYRRDFNAAEETDAETSFLFKNTLRAYFKQTNIEVDWSTIEDLPQESLVNNLICQLPLIDQDKQLLLEASVLVDRVKSFTAILSRYNNDQTVAH